VVPQETGLETRATRWLEGQFMDEKLCREVLFGAFDRQELFNKFVFVKPSFIISRQFRFDISFDTCNGCGERVSIGSCFDSGSVMQEAQWLRSILYNDCWGISGR